MSKWKHGMNNSFIGICVTLAYVQVATRYGWPKGVVTAEDCLMAMIAFGGILWRMDREGSK